MPIIKKTHKYWVDGKYIFIDEIKDNEDIKYTKHNYKHVFIWKYIVEIYN